LRKLLRISAWLYLAFALALWIFLRIAADRWWLGTVLLFGPLWLALVPLIGVLPVALLFRDRRSILVLVATTAVIVVPVMDLCIPWRTVLNGRADPAHLRLRVLTCNIHRKQLTPAALADLIAAANPDVIALQAWTSQFQTTILETGKWHSIRDDELFLVSRYPIRKVLDIAAGNWARERVTGSAIVYEISTPHGPVPLVNLHLVSPHRSFDSVLGRDGDAPATLSNHLALRLSQSQLVAQAAQDRGGASMLLAGDFNTPVDSEIFRKSWSPACADAFTTAGWGFGYTYYVRRTSTRIDHVLFGADWTCRKCWVGPPVGSPHRPLIADLEWNR
jgi:endonuclease/exonuclease/phosphatase (EEP) superfamily protein YafD